MTLIALAKRPERGASTVSARADVTGSPSWEGTVTVKDRPEPSDLTEALAELNRGGADARADVLRLVYQELKRLAQARMRGERPDHTLQPTALVHEAFIQLISDQDARWENRAHFFGAAAEAMRRILVDYARSHQALKRGGGKRRVALEQVALEEVVNLAEDRCTDVIVIDEALSKLSATDAQKARVVELRFFGGLSVEETAAVMDISPRTVKRDWSFAKAWLFREIGGE